MLTAGYLVTALCAVAGVQLQVKKQYDSVSSAGGDLPSIGDLAYAVDRSANTGFGVRRFAISTGEISSSWKFDGNQSFVFISAVLDAQGSYLYVGGFTKVLVFDASNLEAGPLASWSPPGCCTVDATLGQSFLYNGQVHFLSSYGAFRLAYDPQTHAVTVLDSVSWTDDNGQPLVKGPQYYSPLIRANGTAWMLITPTAKTAGFLRLDLSGLTMQQLKQPAVLKTKYQWTRGADLPSLCPSDAGQGVGVDTLAGLLRGGSPPSSSIDASSGCGGLLFGTDLASSMGYYNPWAYTANSSDWEGGTAKGNDKVAWVETVIFGPLLSDRVTGLLYMAANPNSVTAPKGQPQLLVVNSTQPLKPINWATGISASQLDFCDMGIARLRWLHDDPATRQFFLVCSNGVALIAVEDT